MDMQISRAHTTSDVTSSHRNSKSELRPIIAQFVNWRVLEDKHLSSRNQLKVIVYQMFSKELTERRNNAMIQRKEYLRLHPDIQIKLDYPATLKFCQKGQSNKLLMLEKFLKNVIKHATSQNQPKPFKSWKLLLLNKLHHR